MKKGICIPTEYKRDLLHTFELTVEITDKYQKSLDSKKDRSTSVSEYYEFSVKLSECVLLANSTAKSISEQIEKADAVDDFTAMEHLNALLEKYIQYRANVESFLAATEVAKSTDDFLRVLNHETDVLARKTIVIKSQI